MIAISWFLIIWLVAMAIFTLLTFVTVSVNFRYAPNNFFSYLSTLIFLGVIALIFLIVIPYFMTVDWSQTLRFWQGILFP